MLQCCLLTTVRCCCMWLLFVIVWSCCFRYDDRGIAPKRRHVAAEGLSTAEVKELLKRGESERDGMDAHAVLRRQPGDLPRVEAGGGVAAVGEQHDDARAGRHRSCR